MNTKFIVPIIIIVLLLLGGGGYYLSQKDKTTPPQNEITIEQKDTSKENNVMTSLSDLMNSGKSQTCTYTFSDEKMGKSEGAVYISNDKMRGDFSGTGPDGKQYTGSIINDGTYSYSWSSAMKQGVKFPITEMMKKEIDNAQQNPNQYLDPKKKVDYKCNTWTVDATKFTPPTDIKFVDYSEQMKQVEKMQQSISGIDMKAAQCKACDGLPEAQKSSCKTSLQCP